MKVSPAERSSSSTSLTFRPRKSSAQAGVASSVQIRSQLTSRRCFMFRRFPQPPPKCERIDRQRHGPDQERTPDVMRDEVRAARLLRQSERQSGEYSQRQAQFRESRMPLAEDEV